VDWIQLGEGRVQWPALVDTVINFRVSWAERILVSQEGLCSMELVIRRDTQEHKLAISF
jgi:hypothetical protein